MSVRFAALALMLLPAACATTPADREPDEAGAEPLLSAANVTHVVVKEAFVTLATPDENVDSPAAWASDDGKLRLFATSKATDRLMVYDGETGALLERVGRGGANAGEFSRPNGIFAVDDLLFVVERDNHRVQVLRLPDLRPLGNFGAGELTQPYGLWLQRVDNATYDVIVSDAYMAGKDALGDDIVPPLTELGRRFQRFRVSVGADTVRARAVGAFGDTDEAGAIRIPESLWGDPAHDRLLISEEDIATGTAVREYDISGRFRGRTLGLGLFRAQAEGIALWSCPDGSGYWLTTDQFKDRTLFHVFDRQTLAHLGAFAGAKVANTDGVWLHQSGSARFPNGVFYAVDDDQGVGAFDWRDIAGALALRPDCAAR